MPRRPRFVVPGVPHHVTQRGNNRQDGFLLRTRPNPTTCRCFANARDAMTSASSGWCLMSNHVHLVAIPGGPESLALALGQAHSQYSLEQNRHKDRSGHLWQGRYFACPLESDRLLSAIRYVELNPVRAGMMAEAWDWQWSSARAHTSPQVHDELLDWPWREWMEEARLGVWSYADWKATLLAAEPPEELDRMRRATKLGEPLGSDEFVRDLEGKAGRRLRVWTQGRPPAKKVGGGRGWSAVAIREVKCRLSPFGGDVTCGRRGGDASGPTGGAWPPCASAW